jgi:hypothetical protein
MKYITLIIGLLVVGCGETYPPPMPPTYRPINPPPPTTNTNEVDGTTAKPVKELTLEEKVVGEYESKLYGNTYKQVFLENGVYEWHQNGKKVETEYTWSIVDGEIHLKYGVVAITVFRINPDKSITMIADIFSRKREEKPKEDQQTYKKIK